MKKRIFQMVGMTFVTCALSLGYYTYRIPSPEVQHTYSKIKNSLMNAVGSRGQSEICKSLEQSLLGWKLKNNFRKVELHILEKQLEDSYEINQLKECISLNANSPYRIEAEAFTSHYSKESADDINFQISVYETNRQNKIAEVSYRAKKEQKKSRSH